MLNPPERFPEELLRGLLAQHWNLQVTAMEYLPLGFGNLAEIALYTAQFLRPHTDAPNERLSWQGLTDTVASLETTAARI